MQGTFWDPEYSYITASVQVHASMLTDPVQQANLYKGSLQVYISYAYTGVNSLIKGHFPDSTNVVWSERIGLLPATTTKWEIVLRNRRLEAESFYWKIPQLTAESLDYSVKRETFSLAYLNASTAGYVEVAKIYLRLDDRDDWVRLIPYQNLFDLLGAWGGFLSILIAAGTPAAVLNSYLWSRAVKKLIKNGEVVFNENTRMEKSHVMAHTFVHPDPGSRPLGVSKRPVRNSSVYGRRPQTTGRTQSSNSAFFAKAFDMEKGVVPSSAGGGGGGSSSSGGGGGAAAAAAAAQTRSSVNDSAELPPSSSTELSGAGGGKEAQGGTDGAGKAGSNSLSAMPGQHLGLERQNDGKGGERQSDRWRRISDACREGSVRGGREGGESREASVRGDGGASYAGAGAGSGTGGAGSRPGAGDAVGSSIHIDYDGDVFRDDDSDAEDYSDVVRHVASECNALYHMRKLTRLVQEKTSLVSCIVKEDSQPTDSPKE
ncbi:MAG: hypothetical protein WDW38_010228 [Sanguina aurantia]